MVLLRDRKRACWLYVVAYIVFYKGKKGKWRIWVKPWLLKRNLKGSFCNILRFINMQDTHTDICSLPYMCACAYIYTVHILHK